LPDLDQSLLFPGNAATPWFFNARHLAVAGCAVAYAFARRSERRLSRAQAARALAVWLPGALVAVAATSVALFAASTYAPLLIYGEAFDNGRHNAFGSANLIAYAVALALCIRVLARRPRNDIDFAVGLTLLAGIVGLALGFFETSRYDTTWSVTHGVFLYGSTFVLFAAIRDLIGRSGESLRIESDQLRSEALAYERNAAVEASLVKSRFVATVSHELRTPLGGIIGMAELLERTPLTERQRNFTAAIRTSASTLFRIVNDLLDFSRAESGRLELEERPYNLDRTVVDVVTLFEPQARQSGIALTTYVDPSLPPSVIGDQTRVKQVLQNLVSNALRFTREGSVSVEVVPEAVDGEIRYVSFSVRDTGIGIAKQAQEQIFDPFVQEDATTARRFGGTGLGLSIARHLVEMMGGRISVNSIVGLGSLFTFTIPFRPVSGATDQPPSLRDIGVVAVESDPEVRALLTRYFNGWEMPHAVVPALPEAQAALARVERGAPRFDILIVGAGFSDEEATQFAQAVRGNLMLAPSCTILVREGIARREALHYRGFDACVGAPLRQSELFDTIVRLRRGGFAERVLPTIAGIAARPARSERILVAEDNEVNQELLLAQLEHLGFAAEVVGDGKSAIEAASANAYELIFLDCQMPGIDGFQAARRIREGERNRHIPIIAVTANVLPGYRELCLAAGMSDYLAKPALIGPLAALLDRWLPANGTGAAEPVAASHGMPEGPLDEWLPATRERLREIFHGDEARVTRVIARSLSTLRESVRTLRGEIEGRDADAAARTAHRLKGIALEIGLFALALTAGSIESAARKQSWAEAASTFETFERAVESTAAAVAAATQGMEGSS
jgi:signal transduction histidine kinase/CheY-like chemotaxis protein/HPt (histidine-containing phosphotransfer) domain-containing protein